MTYVFIVYHVVAPFKLEPRCRKAGGSHVVVEGYSLASPGPRVTGQYIAMNWNVGL